MISGRILGVVLVLVAAYATVYLGDGLFRLPRLLDPTTSDDFTKGVETLVIVGLLAVLATGVLAWWHTMRQLVNNIESACRPQFLVEASIALLAIALLFGFFAKPFLLLGPYPWAWVSTWDIFMLLAAIPLIFVVHGIVLDVQKVAQSRRARTPARTSDEKVTKLHS